MCERLMKKEIVSGKYLICIVGIMLLCFTSRFPGSDVDLHEMTLMAFVTYGKECCEYILRIIMNDSMLTVLDNQVQVDYKNLHGRSAVLDCVAKSGDGRLFNVEIQQEDEGAIPKRARYHLGLMDMNVLNPGEFFDKLPETYIIFVTQDDTLGYRLPIAHVDRIIKENGAEFGDEAHIIYVDSSKHEDTELGRLMHDFHCKAASDMQDGVLAKRIYELKESEEGVTHMCKVLEEIREEGRMEDKMETANNLYKMGMPLEQIAQAVQVSVQMIQEWLSGETSPVK